MGIMDREGSPLGLPPHVLLIRKATVRHVAKIACSVQGLEAGCTDQKDHSLGLICLATGIGAGDFDLLTDVKMSGVHFNSRTLVVAI